MNKKVLLVGLVIFALINIALASYYIYSNIVTVNVGAYHATLTVSNLNPNQYDNITLSATLDRNGSPAGPDRTIHFYQGATEIGTAQTDINGVASLEWNMTNVGALEFKAGYEVP